MNYVLYGEEQYEAALALQSILKQHHVKKQDLNLISYDALHTDIQMIMEDAMTIPFFADEKVILIQNANFLSTINDTDIDISVIDKYLDHPMPSTILIFMGSFEKLDARKKIVKKVQKCCKVLQFRKLDALGKENYIKDELKRRKLKVDKNVLSLLIRRLPLDIRTIKQEIDKLELYDQYIDAAVAEQLITRPLEEDVFQLVNAVVERDIKKSFTLWKDLCVLNKDPIYLLALLAGQFRFMYQVTILMNLGAHKEDIVAKLKSHPYRVTITMRTTKSMDADQLLHILSQIAELDQKLKGGMIDKKLGFELLLLNLQGVNNCV